MTRLHALRHEFVEFIPEELEDGVLYISIPYATTQHKCMCGCGNKVVLPLHPTHWKLTYDGEHVSLSPSVGNWSFPCRSHYWIKGDRVEWAGRWSDERIARGRAEDKDRRASYLAQREEEEPAPTAPEQLSAGIVSAVLRRFRRSR